MSDAEVYWKSSISPIPLFVMPAKLRLESIIEKVESFPSTRQIVRHTVITTAEMIANTMRNVLQDLRSLRKNDSACFSLLLKDVFCVITCNPHFTYKDFFQSHRNG